MSRRIALAASSLAAAWLGAAFVGPERVGVTAEVAAAAVAAAAAAHGWHVAETADERTPFEQQGWAGPGKEVVLVGPTTVSVQGFYCSNHGCDRPIPALEAVEVWLMPASGGGGGGFNPMAMRAPALIYDSRRLQVHALVSRWWPGSTFDAGFTAGSSETSVLGPPRGDLPVSWPDWAADIASALDRAAAVQRREVR